MILEADVVIISDFRFPGGTSHSVAEEVKAQSDAGFQTVIFHARSTIISGPSMWSPVIRQLTSLPGVRVASAHDELRAEVVVIRHPTIVTSTLGLWPTIQTNKLLMVANHVAQDGQGEHYSVASVTSKLRNVLGLEPVWAPIGPVVRQSLLDQDPDLNVSDEDWLNVINDVGHFPKKRGPVGGGPVIGRHSRPQQTKWPSSAETLLQAYPETNDIRVEILGGAEVARQVLGRIPANWNVVPFGGESPQRFLQRIDFWVYFHHEDLREAFGRSIMEALAAGNVVILPKYLEETYGDAALYIEPRDVVDVVWDYWRNPDKFLRQSARGQDFSTKFGPRMHLQRLESLGASPHRDLDYSDTQQVDRTDNETQKVPRKRILFVTSNGGGMGHLTRLLSVALRLPKELVQPVFASLSTAAHLVRNYEIPFEYISSSADLSMSSRDWNVYFEDRLSMIIEEYKIDHLVFDGTMPYAGLLNACRGRGIQTTWMRRGMWKQDLPSTHLRKDDDFDTVIEPGEIAGEYDNGLTKHVTNKIVVDPITLLSREDLLSREEARRELGYNLSDKVALVTLGTGSVDNFGVPQDWVLSWFAENAPEWRVVVTQSPLESTQEASSAETVSVHPLAQYTHAFDVAVSAAGYNSYHEWMVGRLPALWVAKARRTDDQIARCRWAGDFGYGLFFDLDNPSEAALDLALRRLVDPSVLVEIQSRLDSLDLKNGAQAAAKILLGDRA